jgi:hypothetical protein
VVEKMTTPVHLAKSVAKLSDLSEGHVGCKITVSGRVASVRNFGGIWFLIIEDGIERLQCVFMPGKQTKSGLQIEMTIEGDVGDWILVTGELVLRPKQNVKGDQKFGAFELVNADYVLLFPASTKLIKGNLKFSQELEKEVRVNNSFKVLGRLGFVEIRSANARLIVQTAFGSGLESRVSTLLSVPRWMCLCEQGVVINGHDLTALELDEALRVLCETGQTIQYLSDAEEENGYKSIEIYQENSVIGRGRVRALDLVLGGVERYSLAFLYEGVKDSSLDKGIWDSTLLGKIVVVGDGALTEKVGKMEFKEQQEILQRIISKTNEGHRVPELAVNSILTEFEMSENELTKLLQLLPREATDIYQMSPEIQFQYLWSILGNENVRLLLSDESAFQIARNLGQKEILKNLKQTTYLTKSGLNAANMLMDMWPKDKIEKELKNLLSESPGDFSTLVDSLRRIGDVVEKEEIKEILASGLVTSEMIKIWRKVVTENRGKEQFWEMLKSVACSVFTNKPCVLDELVESFIVNCPVIIEACGSERETLEEVALEAVFYACRPINMDYVEFRKNWRDLSDLCDHVQRAGLKTEGGFWSGGSGAFRDGDIEFYLSKNKASFFAKASAGICTARDQSLFNREDHFHLNLVDRNTYRFCGNVQIYILDEPAGRVLYLRGINPSQKILKEKNIAGLVNTVFRVVEAIAKTSGISTVLLADPLGLWNADSGRIEVRALLADLYGKMSRVSLSKKLSVFMFKNRELFVDHGYLLYQGRDA